MNRQRRKRIADVQSTLIAMQAEVDCIRDEEQEALDNLPESLQEAEKGERMQECIDLLEEVSDSIGDAVDNLDESNYE